MKYDLLFGSLGYGVKAEKEFTKGDFILQYKGDVIDDKEAAVREELYSQHGMGCFMYYFNQAGKEVWYVSASSCIELFLITVISVINIGWQALKCSCLLCLSCMQQALCSRVYYTKLAEKDN